MLNSTKSVKDPSTRSERIKNSSTTVKNEIRLSISPMSSVRRMFFVAMDDGQKRTVDKMKLLTHSTYHKLQYFIYFKTGSSACYASFTTSTCLKCQRDNSLVSSCIPAASSSEQKANANIFLDWVVSSVP